MSKKITLLLAAAVTVALNVGVHAQAPTGYGNPIGLDDAKKAAGAAIAEAKKNNFSPYVIAIVDPAGYLLYFERMENAQYASVEIAIEKARSAALFRRPTKVFEDAMSSGRTNLLGLHGAVPIEGGIPFMADGKVIGAIGASGGTPSQDGQVAKSAIDAVK